MSRLSLDVLVCAGLLFENDETASAMKVMIARSAQRNWMMSARRKSFSAACPAASTQCSPVYWA